MTSALREAAADPLRVLFLLTRDATNPGFTGGDLVPWQCARYLASLGHDITVVTSSFRLAPHEERIEAIRVIRLGGILTLWLRTFAHYMRHCRDKFDVVVTEGFGGSRIPRLAPLYVRQPIITEWHQVHDALFSVQYPAVLVPFLNLLERATAFVHRRTFVVARTSEGRDDFSRIGFKPNNVFVIPAAVEEDWLDYHLAGSVTKPRIVWLGKFRRYKCPDHVIAAMDRVTKVVPDAHLIVAGRHDDRRYEEHLAAMVKRSHLSDQIELRFNLSEESKRDLLKSCRVLVLPSSVEGFGVVVLEANACGVPVIASSGVPVGAVAEGRNGLRYQFGDIAGLSGQLIRVLTDDDLYLQLSRSSLEFARGFAFHKVFAKYEALVRLAAGKPGASP